MLKMLLDPNGGRQGRGGDIFLGEGGRLLQVDTFTAERYSPHWMNWVDTPARRPAARPANKTSPQKQHTKMATMEAGGCEVDV
jgi:hypothetical protein